MSLSTARSTRAFLIAVMTLVAAAGCATTHVSPQPTPSGDETTTFDISTCMNKPCGQPEGFICVGGTDCSLNVRRNCVQCVPAVLQYRLTVISAAKGTQVTSGRLVFTAGARIAILRFRASASVTSAQVALSINGTVVHQQTVTAAA